MNSIILPPKCLGILGGGQLGMMLALVAKQFGYQVVVLEADANCPASRVADKVIVASYGDNNALDEMASICDVITTEFENVPARAVEYLNQSTPVYPSASALLIAQNRLKEKTFFRSLGLETANFIAINNATDCVSVQDGFFPAILKTSTLGYDGKGQIRVNSVAELEVAYRQLGGECILEQMVQLASEVSIIVARNNTGSAVYPLIENQHRNGILDVSYIPAKTSADISAKAQQAALAIVDGLNYIGLLTIEFFITTDDRLLINEIAPRPHNSGHITIEVATTSQFEQQLRAVCGLPLGATELKSKGAMLNLLGDIWLNDSISPEEILLTELPEAKYHSYGKAVAKAGRKMGHISISNTSHEVLVNSITLLKHRLGI